MFQVSVPLRGYGFEIVPINVEKAHIAAFPSPYGDMVLKSSLTLYWMELAILVSVPLRGYGFEIIASLFGFLLSQPFPSPYGDMVLKSHGKVIVHCNHMNLFPSPYGDMVLKCTKMYVLEGVIKEFPSPYGDMVLK